MAKKIRYPSLHEEDDSTGENSPDVVQITQTGSHPLHNWPPVLTPAQMVPLSQPANQFPTESMEETIRYLAADFLKEQMKAGGGKLIPDYVTRAVEAAVKIIQLSKEAADDYQG